MLNSLTSAKNNSNNTLISSSQISNPFDTAFIYEAQRHITDTVQDKTEFLLKLIKILENYEDKISNEKTLVNTISVSSVVATLFLFSLSVSNPLLFATSVCATLVTIGSGHKACSDESKGIKIITSYKAVLEVSTPEKWARVWHIAGSHNNFLLALSHSASGVIDNDRFCPNYAESPFDRACSVVAQLKGISLDDFEYLFKSQVNQLPNNYNQTNQIKDTFKADLNSQDISANQNAIDHQDTSNKNNSEVADLVYTPNNSANSFTSDFLGNDQQIISEQQKQDNLMADMYKVAMSARDKLVYENNHINKDDAPLGCIILAAPGTGKSTFLGTIWGSLRKIHRENFRCLAIVVKKSDVEPFKVFADMVINCDEEPLKAALKIIEFVNCYLDKEVKTVNRLFIDDLLSAGEILMQFTKGIWFDIATKTHYQTKADGLKAGCENIVRLSDHLKSKLYKLWTAGREYNTCLYVSTQSSNVADLFFISSSDARSIGNLIFLAKNEKRDYIESALKNDYIIPKAETREDLKKLLDSLDVRTGEPIMLTSLNNWTLGVVPKTIRQEYESLINQQQTTSNQPTSVNQLNTSAQSTTSPDIHTAPTKLQTEQTELNDQIHTPAKSEQPTAKFDQLQDTSANHQIKPIHDYPNDYVADLKGKLHDQVAGEAKNVEIEVLADLPTYETDELSSEFLKFMTSLTPEEVKVLDKIRKLNKPVTVREVVQTKPLGKSGDNSTSKIKYCLDNLVLKNKIKLVGNQYSII